MAPETTLEEIYRLYRQKYSDLPAEAFFKQDMLRLGVAFAENAFPEQEYKHKDYFIFSFDRIPQNEMRGENWKAPEEIRISGGGFHLQNTVISVRINTSSPYRICLLKDSGTEPEGPNPGKLALTYRGEYLCDVEYPPLPQYYKLDYPFDKPVGEVAPVIEWGYLIYLTVFRNCQYFGKEEECFFCDINHNWRQQKGAGRPYTGVKPVEMVLEALQGIDRVDQTAKAYTLTGGSIIKQLARKDEITFYSEYAAAINQKFPGRWISKVVTQAYEKEKLKPLVDAGVEIYHPNFEIWDETLFKKYCPGKERYIGREAWLRRIIASADLFGAEKVIPNFVAGVELAGESGFQNVPDAVKSALEGVEFFMKQGIVSRFTTWCPEPFTVLGDEEPADIEYYMLLLRGYRDLMQKYKLNPPPGYGPVGAGKAVFSVSAFMDVL